jgi:hypothetical protein
MLPLDITAEDASRGTSEGSYVSIGLAKLVRLAIGQVSNWYSTCTIEDYTGIHIELVVEKLDLVGMLRSVTDTYKIPVTCSRGWSDLHSRAALLKRCDQYEQSVIFMFGDHDPGGLSITDSFKANLDEVFIASGLNIMPELSFERVGLNADDIDNLGLVWIDGLETSSGRDLASPKHPDHYSQNIQNYLREFGARKCEANALLRSPEAAEQILLNALDQYIEHEHLLEYQEQVLRDKQAAGDAVAKLLEMAI